MNTQLEHHSIHTNGIVLHTVQAGPEDGAIVVLLHGFPEFWYGWQHQIPALVQVGYRVVIPDQRGYNLSDKPKGIAAYNLDQLAADVLGIIDTMGREKVFLVGHDWGAAVAWHVASKAPERLEKLAILNVPHPAVMIKFLSGSFQQMRKSWYIFFFQLPWLPEAMLRGKNWRIGRRMLSGSRPDSFTREDHQRYLDAWSQPGAITAMINWYRAMIRSKPETLPSLRIRVPTLVVWGKQDVALRYRDGPTKC